MHKMSQEFRQTAPGGGNEGEAFTKAFAAACASPAWRDNRCRACIAVAKHCGHGVVLGIMGRDSAHALHGTEPAKEDADKPLAASTRAEILLSRFA